MVKFASLSSQESSCDRAIASFTREGVAFLASTRKWRWGPQCSNFYTRFSYFSGMAQTWSISSLFFLEEKAQAPQSAKEKIIPCNFSFYCKCQ